MRIVGSVSRAAASRAVLAWLLLACCGPAAAADGAAPRSADGLAAATGFTVLVTVPAGATAPEALATSLERLRRSGIPVLWLAAQPGPKPPGFASLAIVRFAREADLEAWMAVDGAAAGEPVRVRRADVLVHDGVPGTPAAASFFAVNLYEPHVPQADYLAYSRSYVVPNMAHQKASGALLAFTMYFERPAGAAGARAVLVKEYGSPAGQARGEAEKERFKQDVLLKQDGWKRLHESKGRLRTDLSETFARPIVAAAPDRGR